MKNSYFEAIRICQDGNTKEEFEMRITMLFSSITRIEEPAPSDDTFQNRAAKVVVWTDNGTTPWLLMEYDMMRTLWLEWLDAASGIQSVFRNN